MYLVPGVSNTYTNASESVPHALILISASCMERQIPYSSKNENIFEGEVGTVAQQIKLLLRTPAPIIQVPLPVLPTQLSSSS